MAFKFNLFKSSVDIIERSIPSECLLRSASCVRLLVQDQDCSDAIIGRRKFVEGLGITPRKTRHTQVVKIDPLTKRMESIT